MVNSVYVGPQGELLESIDAFNQQYNTDLETTKQFTLKPGGYDKLKKAYVNWALRWDMRPRGISSIFNRIAEYRWRANDIKRDAIRLEEQMLRLRSTGMVWQDNMDDFDDEINKLKTIIIDAIETCKELYPNVDISVKIIPNLTGRINPQLRRNRYTSMGREAFPELGSADMENPAEYIVAFYIHMKDPNMTVHHLVEDGTIEQYTFPCNDIIVASGTYLLPLVSRNWGRDTLHTGSVSSRNTSYFLDTMYLSPFAQNSHPYIGTPSDLYTWELGQYTGHATNICTGNMATELRTTILNAQIEAHITYLITWLTNYYIPQTNPLNQIDTIRRIGSSALFSRYSHDCQAFIQPNHMDSCKLGVNIMSGIDRHSRAEYQNRTYSARHLSFSPSDPEYLVRKEDYINQIKLSDMPCNDCIWSIDCKQKVNVFTLFQEESYTPMEEAYIGMLWEISRWNNVNENGNRSSRRHHNDFLEEAIEAADYHDPSSFYDIIIECNACVKKWFLSNDEIFNPEWSNERFRSRFRTVLRLSDTNRQGLFEQLLDQDSTFVWTRDNVENYRAPSRRRAEKPEPVQVRFDEEDAEVLDILQDEEPANLTAEQRTLIWATTMGGSTNL
tara:strand:- start:1635 stop:3476 length:1842 start_codon:yes stop_codon:yes gene_type:complete